jgi:hypothetical protein
LSPWQPAVSISNLTTPLPVAAVQPAMAIVEEMAVAAEEQVPVRRAPAVQQGWAVARAMAAMTRTTR